MSTRTTPKTARGVLRKAFKEDAELTKDVAALFSFAAVLATPTPLGIAAALGLLLQTSGSIVSAAANLTDRFRGDDGSPGDSLQSYERFSALFFLATIRAYMEALDEVVTAAIDALDAKADESDADTKERRIALQEAQLRAKDVHDADLTYLFAVEPLTDEVPLLAALHEWLTVTLVALGLRALEARMLADKCDASARGRFKVALAANSAESAWMRNFLALQSDSATRASIEDLRSATTALRGWLVEREVPASSHEAWDEYRKSLVALPDMSATMYSESFGVSKVFQTPIVQYHIGSARGEAGRPHQIDDVGRLLGALVSVRTEGQDLIILSGGPGSGKSTLCRVFVSELAQSPEAFPIFLQLRRVKEGAEIAQFIEEGLQARGLVNRISDLLTLPNVVLILDGFDELVAANRSRLRQFFNALLDETQTGPLRNAHVIVSGRDTLFPGGQGLPPGSHVVALQPFDRARVEAWGRRWRSQHASGPGCTFRPEVYLSDADGDAPAAEDGPLQHLVTWPLTLHLVARVHTAGGLPNPAEAGGRIDKAYLYRSILAETSERQAGQVAGRGRLEPERMRAFLRKVAWMMYTRAVDSLDVGDVMPLLDTLGDGHDGLEPTQLAEVAVLNAPELAKGEETGFEFVHKSFSEFLAAEGIAEHVERASFRVPEFGSQVPAWRMSDAEASSALADVLGIRLVPQEVQDMLEPMLGAVLQFRAGRRVEETVPREDRRVGLEAVLERCESLYSAGLSARDGFGALEGVVKRSASVSSVLEGLANYLLGLALVGCAAAEELGDESGSGGNRKFNAEPEPGAMWRFIALVHGGGIAIDESLGRRLFGRMKAGGTGEGEVVTESSVPWKLHLLDGMEGYRSEIRPAVERALGASEVTNRLLAILLLVMAEIPEEDLRLFAAEPERGMPRRVVVDALQHMQYEFPRHDAAIELAYLLGLAGSVSPALVEGWVDHRRYRESDLTRLMHYIRDDAADVGSEQHLEGLLRHVLAEMSRIDANPMLMRLVEESVLRRSEWWRGRSRFRRRGS